MSALRFRNMIASLFNLDRDVLETAGVIDLGATGNASWRALNDSPARWVLRLDDERLGKLWALIEARQKPEDRLTDAAQDTLKALKMIRDADDDNKSEGNTGIPEFARNSIDRAIAAAEGGS